MRRFNLLLLTICLSFFILCVGCAQQANKAKAYHRIVVASDVHYVTKSTDSELRKAKKAEKEQAMRRLNNLQDVDLVVFTGDIIERLGNTAEYEQSKIIYDKCTQPKTIIAGNHEIFYSNDFSPKGALIKAAPELRKQRQEQFKTTFNQKSLYYTKEFGKYLLVFLAPDMLDPEYTVELSDTELSWLDETLTKNSTKPTILFCHAPLKDTLAQYSKNVNKGKNIAQPADKIDEVLMRHPQIKLWVSGHTHTKIKNESFANAKFNMYKGKFLNIHNSTWEDKNICVNSLFLYDDRIEITTFNLTKKEEIEKFKRVVKL